MGGHLVRAYRLQVPAIPLSTKRLRLRTPETPLSRILRRNGSHESYDSVSTTPSPSTWRHPSESQPIAVTTAVEATRPSRLHLV